MVWGLALPALGLILAGWVLPQLLARLFPQGVRPLIWLTLAAVLAMLALSMALFLGLYLIEGLPLETLAGPGRGALIAHLARLALGSALIWGPVLALSVEALHRRRRRKTW